MSAPLRSMRPLDEADDAMLADVEGVALDLDDTLTRGGALELESLEALRALEGAGLPRMIVTGRPIGWTEPLALLLPITAAIGENGAGWAYAAPTGGHRVLRRGRFVDVDLGPERAALIERVRRAHPEVRLAADHPLRACDVAFDIGEAARLSRPEIAALRATVESAGARVVVSSVHLHGAFGDWDKPTGVTRAAAEVLGIDAETVLGKWIFVGDSGNDAPAFARFARTAGVANVKDHLASLSVPPRWVTRADRGRGVLELAQRIVAARSAAHRGGA